MFYAIRHGSVALELHVPARDAVTIDTLHDGDLLGWSWLFPPYRWEFDGRAREDTALISFDGACLRGKCDADHELGYELMKPLRAGDHRAPAGDAAAGCWTSMESALLPDGAGALSRRRSPPGDGGHLDLGAGAGRPRRGHRVRAGPVHDAVCVRCGGGADLDQRRSGCFSAAGAHGPSGGRRERRDLPYGAGADARGARPVRQSLAGRGCVGQGRGDRGGRHRSRAAAAGHLRGPERARPVRGRYAAVRRPRSPSSCSTRASSSSGASAGFDVEVTVDIAAADMARPGGGGADADRARPVRLRRLRSRSCAGPRR